MNQLIKARPSIGIRTFEIQEICVREKRLRNSDYPCAKAYWPTKTVDSEISLKANLYDALNATSDPLCRPENKLGLEGC